MFGAPPSAVGMAGTPKGSIKLPAKSNVCAWDLGGQPPSQIKVLGVRQLAAAESLTICENVNTTPVLG